MLWTSRFRASRQALEAHAITWMSASGSSAAICSRISAGRLGQPGRSPRRFMPGVTEALFPVLGGHAEKAICAQRPVTPGPLVVAEHKDLSKACAG